MWNIAVCDDEAEMRGELCDYIRRYAQGKEEEFSVLAFASGEEMLQSMPADVDVLLLDIKMQADDSGLRTARRLRELGNKLCIIFITTMTQYSLEGYEVHAFSFLQKPVMYERLCRVMDDALRMVGNRRHSSITLTVEGGLMVCSVHDIVYIESYRHDVNVMLRTGAVKTTTPLQNYEIDLAGHTFFRCHKSYLVNLRFIRGIDKEQIRLSTGASIPLSKHRRKEFMACFAKYATEVV